MRKRTQLPTISEIHDNPDLPLTKSKTVIPYLLWWPDAVRLIRNRSPPSPTSINSKKLIYLLIKRTFMIHHTMRIVWWNPPSKLLRKNCSATSTIHSAPSAVKKTTAKPFFAPCVMRVFTCTYYADISRKRKRRRVILKFVSCISSSDISTRNQRYWIATAILIRRNLMYANGVGRVPLSNWSSRYMPCTRWNVSTTGR